MKDMCNCGTCNPKKVCNCTTCNPPKQNCTCETCQPKKTAWICGCPNCVQKEYNTQLNQVITPYCEGFITNLIEKVKVRAVEIMQQNAKEMQNIDGPISFDIDFSSNLCPICQRIH